jgi:hypothetical protein
VSGIDLLSPVEMNYREELGNVLLYIEHVWINPIIVKAEGLSMCQISYEHLRKLWLEQTELHNKCTDDLIRGAYTLRSRLAELIKAPERWIDPVNSKEYRYIEIISLKTKASPDNPQDLIESINEKGILSEELVL